MASTAAIKIRLDFKWVGGGYATIRAHGHNFTEGQPAVATGCTVVTNAPERALFAQFAADGAAAVKIVDTRSSRAASDGRNLPLRLARNIYRFRRNREAVFGKMMFADPAWDLLLDLYIARCEGRAICVSSACIAAAAPVTTALRWIKQLENDGIIIRELDTFDNRRCYVRLSDEYFIRMEKLLSDTLRLLLPQP